jgi:Flp pilus assembly pilin Flp
MRNVVKIEKAQEVKKGFQAASRCGRSVGMQKRSGKSLLRDNKGQGLIEYALIIVLMGLMAVGTIRSLGEKAHNAFYQAGTTMDSSTTLATGNGNSTKNVATN